MTTEQRNLWRGIESSPIDLTAVHPQQPHITRYDEELEDESLYPSRMPSSTRRYDQQKQTVTRPGQQGVRAANRYDEVNYYIRRRPRSQGNGPRQQEQTTTRQRPTRRVEPATTDDDDKPRTQPPNQSYHAQVSRHTCRVWVGIGMIAVLLLWIVGALVMNWWSNYQDDLHYGRPRTSQMDARVGHNDAHTSSHFIALNLHGQVEVVEFPGGDATKAKVYLGPSLTGQNSDLDIVTVSFKDVNGDGKPDMILNVNGGTYVFINENGAFRTVRPNDHIKM
ncbi:MAG: hypothetical protein PVS3B3_36190 [Ktedonobacteraceae bacterium]